MEDIQLDPEQWVANLEFAVINIGNNKEIDLQMREGVFDFMEDLLVHKPDLSKNIVILHPQCNNCFEIEA